jgi:XTP/dITP diphosphohydrolase
MVQTLILGTRNAHKAQEIKAILSEKYSYLTLKDFPAAPTTVEDGKTFASNAMKKSIELAKWLSATPEPPQHSCVLADDSGLEVDALNGAPGVYSARFAALDRDNHQNSSDAENNAKLLRLLHDVPAERRQARFRCVLALTPILETATTASPVCYVDAFEIQTQLFEGTCEGSIAFHAAGSGGFGYDPLFVPDGFKQSLAELGEDVKNQISHRSKALSNLRRHLGLSNFLIADL